MIKISMNSAQFRKDMNNILDYSFGFLDGVHRGKTVFFHNLGKTITEVLNRFIDSTARMDEQSLHHVYEWYQTGSPNARLYDIRYVINNNGLNFVSSFKQSTTIKDGSRVPFYNKAKIMEEGTTVIIEPRNSDVLVFEDNGEEVFTKNPVVVTNPGGDATVGSFEKTMNTFFTKYFTQAFLRSSGIADYLENPILFKKNINVGKKSGRAKGLDTGYRWIINAGVISNG
jgi:hypothetical protein